MSDKYSNFDVKTVALRGSNLIEASAGTGKTFSVAVLVVRLVLEKGLSPDQILMVTFTKSAVAEMEQRIRAFLRDANKYALKGKFEEAIVKELVDRAIASEGKDTIAKRLRDAITLLDETAIFTINGFCQRTLVEYAFETGQDFNVEMIESESEIIQGAVDEYWRREIVVLDENLLQNMVDEGLERGTLTQIVKKAVEDWKFVKSEEHQATEEKLKLQEQKIEEVEHQIKAFYAHRMVDLKASCDLIGGKTADTWHEHLEDEDTFFEKISSTKSAKVQQSFGEFYDLIEQLAEEKLALKELGTSFLGEIYSSAIEQAKKRVWLTKKRKNLMAFSDQIDNLYDIIRDEEKNEGLVKRLREKYKAVFIDEFQDTDKKQYTIFSKAFLNLEEPLFFIGDPKQSIYAFRKADIETYKKAREAVGENCFTMTKNYRSTADYIKAMNQFFGETPNPFDDPAIEYIKVEKGGDAGSLKVNGQAFQPLQFQRTAKKENLPMYVQRDVLALLEQGEIVDKEGNARKVMPSDIGVLVRGHKEGKDVKDALSKAGIPAVTVDESKVLQSQEATYLTYVLEAMMEADQGAVNKVMLSPLVAEIKHSEINQLNLEALLLTFRDLKARWMRYGVYNALRAFSEKFGLQALYHGQHESGERLLTNFFHIAELLHKQAIERNYSPEEVLDWLKKARQEGKVDGDEFVQRVENDENAVQIVTIHKSKGLAYNIVFAPYLDMSPSIKGALVEYEEDGEYVFSIEKDDENRTKKSNEQAERENRRLIYVALTRAVFGCYLYEQYAPTKSGHKPEAYLEKSSLKPFLYHTIHNKEVPKLEEEQVPEISRKYQPEKEKGLQPCRSTQGIQALDNSWGVLSYSKLSDRHGSVGQMRGGLTLKGYDEFVFRKMPKGASLGNFLHHIFENLDFSAGEESWFRQVIESGRLHAGVFGKEELDAERWKENKDNYFEMVRQVMNAPLPSGFSLSSVSGESMIPEMEFYFDFEALDVEAIAELFPKISGWTDSPRGVMKGFVDLFFEHEGKYYILDWKSNYLGDQLSDYSPDKLDEAMTDHNYHLQYLVYTIAMVRFLRNRIPDFDYEEHFGGVYYLFLRGVRKEGGSGVFFEKIDGEVLEHIEAIVGSQTMGGY